jgi:hypothetical protein
MSRDRPSAGVVQSGMSFREDVLASCEKPADGWFTQGLEDTR